MKKSLKKFRLNVVISYYKGADIEASRHLIQSILKGLACLYNLDYAIDSDTQVFEEPAGELFAAHDLVYFRSTPLAALELKTYQKIIHGIFFHNPYQTGVEVNYQVQRALKDYPFPVHYFRPLQPPYLQEHKDGQIFSRLQSEVL